MAYISIVSGGSQPVFATDVSNGSIAGSTQTTGTPVNFQGPKLDFFQVTANNSVVTQEGIANGSNYVANVLQAIQQTATVAMYQVDGAQISIATYPTGAFANASTNTSASVFLAAANVTYTGYQLNSCTSLGFKLATS